MNARISPEALPKGKPAPVGIGFQGRVSRGSAHPDALREIVLTVDKDVEVDVGGLPRCGYRTIVSRTTRDALRVCRKAMVGMGKIELSPDPPGLLPGPPVTLFNGGLRQNTVMLFAHAFISRPLAQAVIATIEIRSRRGYGLTAQVRIPRILDGQGSLTEFALSLRRIFTYRGERKSFLSAKCPDGRFEITAHRTVFKNETNAPGVAAQTILKGGLVAPCKPRD